MASRMSRRKCRFASKRFGAKLRSLRLGNGLTLQDFAASLGYSGHGYISELEAGKKTPTVELVLSVSRIYRVSIDHLLRDELELQLPDARKGPKP
jgi:transcriptional regulator with XRE-family HTH domain